MMVVSNDKRFRANHINENIANKLYEGCSGKLFSKSMNNEVVYTELCKQRNSLIQCIQKLKSMIIRMQNHSGMRKESKHNRFTLLLFGKRCEPRDYFAVPCMYSIKCANGDNCIFLFLKISYR